VIVSLHNSSALAIPILYVVDDTVLRFLSGQKGLARVVVNWLKEKVLLGFCECVEALSLKKSLVREG